MSGGSWDYVYGQISDVASALKNDTCTGRRLPLPLNEDQKHWRHKLSMQLEKISAALYAIEWVDSDDRSYPDDVDAIKKVFEP